MIIADEIGSPYIHEQIVCIESKKQNSIEALYRDVSSSERFKIHLTALLDSLENEENGEENFAVLSAIEHLILSDMLSWEEQFAFMSSSENKSLIDRLKKLNIAVDFYFEEIFSQSILKGEKMIELMHVSNPLFHPYLERFDTLTRNEVNLLQASSQDTILFIGSGAFPITAIQYVKQTGCTVHCVEKLAERAEIAQKVVNALGMGNQIKMLVTEGQKIDCSPYDAIVVGVLAIPKEEIIQNIIQSAREDARIICRTTIGLREALLSPLKEGESLSLKAIEKKVATGNQILTPILFSKR